MIIQTVLILLLVLVTLLFLFVIIAHTDKQKKGKSVGLDDIAMEAFRLFSRAEFRQIFAEHDSDSDGRIPFSEVTSMLKGIGVSVTEDDVLQEGGDIDSSSMNFEEFLQFLLDKRHLTDPEADIRNAFRLFDKDADGYLTAKDLKQVMLNLGEHLTDEEVTEMIRAADAEDDSKVNYVEFVRIMTSV